MIGMSLTISFTWFIGILLVHYVADFLLQTDEQAKNKATSTKALFNHVLTYSLVWTGFIALTWLSLIPSLLFGIITFISHYITDYFTSKKVKKYFDAGNPHDAFIVIGFDQILHYVQLYITLIACTILDVLWI